MVFETDDGVLLAGESCESGRHPTDGGDWRLRVEFRDDTTDHSPADSWGRGLDIEQARPAQPVALRVHVELAEVLEATAHGKQRCSTPDRVAQRISESLEAARDGELIGVGPTAGDYQVDVGKLRRVRFDVNRSQLNIRTAPGGALNQRLDVTCIPIQVQPFRKQLRDHDAQAG